MKKRSVLKRILLGFAAAVLALLLPVGVIFLNMAVRVDSPSAGYVWNERLEFDKGLGPVVEMNGKALKIMLFTDQHYTRVFGDRKADRLFNYLVGAHNPDLIILLGDQCFTPFNRAAYKRLIKTIDAKKIPWAPIFGNHDGDGKATKNRLAQMLSESSYCLFRYGPENFGGAGNYFINLKDGGDYVYTFYLFDSGKEQKGGYPPLSAGQVKWYEWAINGMAATGGGIVPSSVMVHIPLREYTPAYDEAVAGGSVIYGKRGEEDLPSKINSGMFDKIIELGSTKSVFCGHEHLNDYSVEYKGVRLTYALSSGYGSYGNKKIKGCTILTVGTDGTMQQAPVYYN